MLRGRWRRRHWRVGLQAVVGCGWSMSSERGVRRSGFGRRGGERGDHGRAVAERDPGGDDGSDRWATLVSEGKSVAVGAEEWVRASRALGRLERVASWAYGRKRAGIGKEGWAAAGPERGEGNGPRGKNGLG